MVEETQNAEVELNSALQELEGQEQPSGASIAKGFRAFVDWMGDMLKAGKKAAPAPPPVDDEEAYDEDLDDLDEPEGGAEPAGDDDEDEVDRMLREYGVTDEDEDEAPPPGRKARKARKSLGEAFTDEIETDLPELLDAEQVIGGMLKSFGRALDDRDSDLRREVRGLRKSLNAYTEQVSALVKAVGEATQRPAAAPASVGIRRVVEPFGGADSAPAALSQEEALKRSGIAVRKGLISAEDARLVELAYTAGDPGAASRVLFKLQGVTE